MLRCVGGSPAGGYMVHGRILRWLFFICFTFFLVTTAVPFAWGKKPPWSGGPESPGDYDPVTAPEPMTLSLIGVAGVGVAGHYLAGRKRKK